MLCDRHNEVHVRTRDGTRAVVIRCADPTCAHFTKEVTEGVCSQCPRHVTAVLAKAAAEASAIKSEVVKEVPTLPGLLTRAANWTAAVAGWVAAGRPERSDEEVERIYNTFCAGKPPCRWFEPEKKRCVGCGCNVTDHGPAVLNKIKMATQKCPRGFW